MKVELVRYADVSEYGFLETTHGGEETYYDERQVELERDVDAEDVEVVREVKFASLEETTCWYVDEYVAEIDEVQHARKLAKQIETDNRTARIEAEYGLGQVNDYGDVQEALYCEYCGQEVAPEKAHEVEQRNKPWGVLMACKRCAEAQDELVQLT